jgi:phosphoribosylanthranilate isomerase
LDRFFQAYRKRGPLGQGPRFPFVKICCIKSLDEARLALRYGADALGFVSSMPSGPGVLPLDRIAAICAELPRGAGSVLLTSWRETAVIAEQAKRCGVGALQLCEELASGDYAELRRLLPGVLLIQVVHITGREAVSRARFASLFADALLLDSGNPRGRRRELGGTGRTHDWKISRRIRDGVSCPVILAGGLRPKNVAEAAAAVNPHGVDVCSGLRSQGRLDRQRLADFMQAVQQLRAG